MVGLFLSFLEILLAGGLQGFLYSLQVSSMRAEGRYYSLIPQDSTLWAAVFILTLVFLRGALQFLQMLSQNGAIEYFKCLQRQRVLEWVFHSQMASTARVSTLFTERTNHSSAVIGQVQSAMTYFFSCTVLGIQLLLISPLITGTLVLLSAPSLFFIRKLNRLARSSGLKHIEEWNKTNSRMVSVIKNLLLVRIYHTQEIEERQGIESNLKYRGYSMTNVKVAAFLFNLPQVMGMTFICIAAYYSSKYALLSKGEILIFFYLFVRFSQGAANLNTAVSGAFFYQPQLKELFHWWREEYLPHVETRREEKRLAERVVDLKAEGVGVGWKLADVEFAYPGAAQPVLKHFGISIFPFQTTAIVGSSGAGKSTLINLLLGEYKASVGRVDLLVDEELLPVDTVKGSLKRAVGYVGAESFLVEGTVRENLYYGLPEVPPEEVLLRALENAECGFLKEFPQFLEHRLSEQGHGLSAGQKQRLSLARALLREPKVLILDEATSNLDASTEQRLIETLRSFKNKMTIVIVTHRESLLVLADQVVQLGPK